MVRTDQYRRPEDLPAEIPVFPLQGAILLPRATLPLNIFEPRYLAMIDSVISGSRILGMLQPADSRSDGESPTGKSTGLRRVGCAGRLTAYQELDDGRILITLTGICRFRVTNEVAGTNVFRSCNVDFRDYRADLEAGHGEDDVDREHLLGVLKGYLERRQMKADWRAISNASTEFLVNTLSVISPYGPEEKQALLEASDLKTRANVLVALAEMELAGGDNGPATTLQ